MPAHEPNDEQTLDTPRSAGESGPDDQTRVRTADTVATTPDGSPVVAGYELGGEIARGGMGVVYRARDTAFDREVAVKVMLPRMDAAEFVREARITGRLPHPGIPPVHALGTLPDGRPFLAMKLIKGDTLDKLLRARTDPAADRPQLLAAFEQMCQAVGYAHAQGIVHRDLKPSNVMVGAFGEVQVMDWGLAKVVGAADAEATVPDAGGSFSEDVAATVAGQVKGTPAYMAPEQARGEAVDQRADVFALGGILAAILTGKPPFAGNSVLDTIIWAAKAELGDVYARLDASGADEELIDLAKHCLEPRAEHRPANGTEVTAAVAAYRAGVDERLRRAEQDRAASAAKAEEQKKRRKVQLALAGVVLLVAIGGGVAAVQVQRGFADQQLAAEKQRQEEVREKERQTRATSLVDSLGSAETPVVPRILTDLADLRDLARPKLAELASQPITSKPGLHARLALLPDEPERAKELAGYLPNCKPEELLTIRDILKPHAGAVSPGLWAVLTDAKADAGKRVRTACALAGLTPNDPRWATVAGDVVGVVMNENPLQAAVWAQALEPVRVALLPALLKRYPESRTKIESGTLAVTDLAAEATAFDLTASLLARYTTDRPAELSEVAMTADGRHLPQFTAAIDTNRGAVAPRLEAEIDKTLPADLPSSDPQREALAKRQASAAVILLRLNRQAKVWPLLKHSPDPRVRSYLIHRLFPLGADPAAIIQRLDAEPDLSARRGLLLALGEFDEATLPTSSRTALLPKVQQVYRTEADPGLHAAAEWLLRTWKQEAWLKQVNAEWAMDGEGRDKRIAAIKELVTKDKEKTPPQWYVNTQGQTFVVIPGPVEFTMGSPKTEKDWQTDEVPHTRRIGRSFAIAQKSVTLAEYRSLTKDKYEIDDKYNYDPNLPVVGINWYMAASYCNLLSKEEGIPEDQWVYDVKGPQDIKLKANYLSLTGYRLPTEAEMEYATRAGATTSRYFGESDELLGRYAWYAKSSNDVLKPVGLKKPNDFGLFDAQGNCFTWCQEEYGKYPTAKGDGAVEDTEGGLVIDSTLSRVLRGGSGDLQASYVRSADRYSFVPSLRGTYLGFRPARTFTP
ncbi:MAG: hypothetical protein FJ304_21815 [Planctomycetes bacterium]|nr:hypothetical protein [Planctomycetota bacterium]